MRDGNARAAAAQACVGARFRPHGRDKAYGLDCVGVAAIAFERPADARYALRGGDAKHLAEAVDAGGMARISPEAAGPGDLLMVDAGLGQLHLAVLTQRGFVHADARLRRVVETPGRPEGQVLAAWTEAD